MSWFHHHASPPPPKPVGVGYHPEVLKGSLHWVGHAIQHDMSVIHQLPLAWQLLIGGILLLVGYALLLHRPIFGYPHPSYILPPTVAPTSNRLMRCLRCIGEVHPYYGNGGAIIKTLLMLGVVATLFWVPYLILLKAFAVLCLVKWTYQLYFIYYRRLGYEYFPFMVTLLVGMHLMALYHVPIGLPILPAHQHFTWWNMSLDHEGWHLLGNHIQLPVHDISNPTPWTIDGNQLFYLLVIAIGYLWAITWSTNLVKWRWMATRQRKALAPPVQAVLPDTVGSEENLNMIHVAPVLPPEQTIPTDAEQVAAALRDLGFDEPTIGRICQTFRVETIARVLAAQQAGAGQLDPKAYVFKQLKEIYDHV